MNTDCLLEHAKKTRELLLVQRPKQSWIEVTTRDVTEVILILSSSRGGSSLLFELLRQTDQLLSWDGEHVPFLRLNGFSFPAKGILSDAIDPLIVSNRDIDQLSRDLVAELRVGPEIQQFDWEEFAIALASRLALQWPSVRISASEWLTCINNEYQKLRRSGKNWNTTAFHIDLLASLLKLGYAVNPYLYDIPRPVIDHRFRDHDFDEGPSEDDVFIEEPPFIVTRPRRFPTVEEIRTKPLMMKASVDAYRVEFLRSMFPNARFKIVHLTRNPAASINGLYEGWRYNRGFFSHNLSDCRSLAVSGYSDQYEWGKYWWNFDLPPNWESQTEHRLEYVCGFQWFSAHSYILKAIDREEKASIFRLRFEDLLQSDEHCRATMARLLGFLGIRFDASVDSIMKNKPVVMAVRPPSHRRWLLRTDTVWPVVEQSCILDMAECLQYSVNKVGEWI